MKRSAVGRWVLVSVATALIASQGAFAQYKLKVIASAKEYGGDLYQACDLNNKGQFSFNINNSEKDNGGDVGETTYVWDGTQVVRLAPNASLKLSDGSVLTRGRNWSPHGMSDTKVAWAVDTDKSPCAIVTYDIANKTVEMIANNQTVVEGGKLTSSGGVIGGRMFADVNNKDQVVWSEGLEPSGGGDAFEAVFMYDPATKKHTTIARRGTPLPGGKQVGLATYASINDLGEVVFMANTTDNENYGIYQWAGGTITAICAPGTKVDTLTIAQALHPRNADGFIAFRGELVSNGTAQPVAEDTGYFVYSSATGKITKIVAPGDALPGGKYVATEGANGRRSSAVNKNGQVAFKAVMENEATGVFIWKDGKITPVITSGQTIDGAKVESVVNGIGGSTGYHMGMNDFGDVLVSGIVDGADGFLLLTAPR